MFDLYNVKQSRGDNRHILFTRLGPFLTISAYLGVNSHSDIVGLLSIGPWDRHRHP